MRKILILLSLLVVVTNAQGWKVVGSKVYPLNKFYTISLREALGTGFQLGYANHATPDSGEVRYKDQQVQYYDGAVWQTLGTGGAAASFTKQQIDTTGALNSGSILANGSFTSIDTNKTNAVSDIDSKNSFLTVATAAKKKFLTFDTIKYATAAMTGLYKYSDFARTAFKNESNTFSTGTTQTMPRAVIDSSLTVMGYSPILNTIYTSTEIADTINTTTYDAFGIIGELPNGKKYVIYRQGSAHGGDTGVIAFRSSIDGGAVWSDSTIIKSETGIDLRNVSGGTTPSGRIVFFYLRRHPISGVQLSVPFTYSDDEGKSWSNNAADTLPRTATAIDEFSPYGGLIKIGNNKIMMSWYGGDYATNTWGSYVTFSTDNGTSWIDNTAINVSTTIRASETTIGYLGGGKMVGVARLEMPQLHFYQFTSEDNGLTWIGHDSLDFDGWTSNGSAPWISVSNNSAGEKLIHLYWVNRDEGKLKTIIGTKELMDNTDGWDTATLKTIQNTYSGSISSGYPSVIHPENSGLGFGWFYDQISSTDADITFFCDPQEYSTGIIGDSVYLTNNIKVVHPSEVVDGIQLIGNYDTDPNTRRSPRLMFGTMYNNSDLDSMFIIRGSHTTSGQYSLEILSLAQPDVTSGTLRMSIFTDGIVRLGNGSSGIKDSLFMVEGGIHTTGGIKSNGAVSGTTGTFTGAISAVYVDADSFQLDGTTVLSKATWHSGIGSSRLGNITTGTLTTNGGITSVLNSIFTNNQNNQSKFEIANTTDGTLSRVDYQMTGTGGRTASMTLAAPSYTGVTEFTDKLAIFTAGSTIPSAIAIASRNATGVIDFYAGGSASGNKIFQITTSRLQPASTGAIDIGSPTLEIDSIYVQDLKVSNTISSGAVTATGLSTFGTNSGTATIGAGDSVRVAISGLTTSGVVVPAYKKNTFLVADTVATWYIWNTDTLTIYGKFNETVSYWVGKK